LKGIGKPLSQLNKSERECLGIEMGKQVNLLFESGIEIRGDVVNLLFFKEALDIVTLKSCKMTLKEEILYKPTWGAFDLACVSSISSLRGVK
jgi:phenylalanine-4-hydroxylase